MNSKLDEIFSDIDQPRVYVVSEIGINHNGDLKTALDLIDASAAAGVDAVKFQKRALEQIYTKQLLDAPNSAEWNLDYLIPLLKEVELADTDYEVVRKHTKKRGLDLIITPFDEHSAEFCGELGVAALKIASADMTNLDLVRACSTYGVPLFLSTGMWDEETIRRCTSFFRDKLERFALLLANSTYPSPYEALNIRFFHTLKEIHGTVGYSGHERGIFVPIAAIALGARIVEKHITFDRYTTGPDHKASMYPSEFKEMVQNIRALELSLGSEKRINQGETQAKEAFAKSAYTTRNLPEGHALSLEDIVFRSPGRGIFGHEIGDFIGRKLKRPISGNECISQDDFDTGIEIRDWKLPKFNKRWGVKCRFHDFDLYNSLHPRVIEFHCSDTDIELDFRGGSKYSTLIVHAPELVDRKLVDICSKDKTTVEYSIEILQRTIDKTLEIASQFPREKPKIVMHLGGMSLDQVVEEKSTDLMLERAIENFGELKFDPSDVDVLPENLPPRPWYLGGEWFQYGFMLPEDMVRFCEHLGLKMTFDVCHAGLYCNYSGAALVDYARQVSEIVDHMHISDAQGINGEGMPIHSGNIDFMNVLKLFEHKSFSWVTEIWSGHLRRGKGTYESMHRLSNYLHYL